MTVDGRMNALSPEEKRSMALWDAWCEAMPLTSQERQEIRERDRYAVESRSGSNTDDNRYDEEFRRQRNREYAARYRQNHQDKRRAYNQAHAEEIKERRIEYERFYR